MVPEQTETAAGPGCCFKFTYVALIIVAGVLGGAIGGGIVGLTMYFVMRFCYPTPVERKSVVLYPAAAAADDGTHVGMPVAAYDGQIVAPVAADDHNNVASVDADGKGTREGPAVESAASY
jgi:hypothetical protein